MLLPQGNICVIRASGKDEEGEIEIIEVWKNLSRKRYVAGIDTNSIFSVLIIRIGKTTKRSTTWPFPLCCIIVSRCFRGGTVVSQCQ